MNIFSDNYLASQPIERAMRQFSTHFSAPQRVLDIGCGYKPYAKFFTCEYVGVDTLPDVRPDIVGNAWEIPVADATFDGVVMNQSLEHIMRTGETISEVYRVLKPGGLALITVPQTMKDHSAAQPSTRAPVHNFPKDAEPYWRVDYWRFTKYGLYLLFEDFAVLRLTSTNGYVGTLCQLINYGCASFGATWLFAPLYFVTNVAGSAVDNLVHALFPSQGKFRQYVYDTLTINYVLTVQKPKAT